jgi:hypothetical protein
MAARVPTLDSRRLRTSLGSQPSLTGAMGTTKFPSARHHQCLTYKIPKQRPSRPKRQIASRVGNFREEKSNVVLPVVFAGNIIAAVLAWYIVSLFIR